MAATSYTTLPSSTYAGLGSQGDIFHSANYGTYDTGIGSLTSHPYQYQTHNYGTYLTDNEQPSSYSNDYLHDYSTQQPQYYSTDRYDQDPVLNDYLNTQTQKYNDKSIISNNIDENYPVATINTTQPTHKTTVNYNNIESNNQHQTSHTDTTEHHPPVSTDNQHYQSQPPSQSNRRRSEHNTPHQPPPKQQKTPSQPNRVRSEHDNSNRPPPKQQQKQRHQSQPPSQTKVVRSEHQISNHPPKQPSIDSYSYHSPSNDNIDASQTTIKVNNNSPPELKTTKSNKMRAAAIKQKEEIREQKQKDGNFPSTKKKSIPSKSQQKSIQPPPSDGEQSDKEKLKRNKKQSTSIPKQRKSRRDGYQTEDNDSSIDEDNNDNHTRSKSKRRTALSDPHHEKYPPLPPIRRGRGPPVYDPAYDYPYPPGHPVRGRHPYYDDYLPYGPYPYPGRFDYRHRHLYENAYVVPPYIGSYHDPYDGFFDYEKRKGKHETDREDGTKSKNQKNKNKNDDNENEETTRQRWSHHHDQPYYDEPELLELWRQERNDYLKKKFKPTVHDVLYSQQWMKSDSYLENQRRRALRDTQGYYFPYKKYTLKDYRDLLKMESQNNPYASVNDATLDRKERARKRQEYASQIERQAADASAAQNKTPRDLPPRKPWHLSNGEPRDPEKLSKRDRALEYAKIQVVKHRPSNTSKNRPSGSDPTERFVNGLFPQANQDADDSVNGRNSRNNQTSDDDDQ